MPNSFLADREQDLNDLEERLLNHLLDRRQSGLVDLDAPTIVLAHDLTPSQTARLDRRWVRGFVTEAGGEGGHTAILAKGLELPAVVGAGSVLGDVASGDLVIVDGDAGLVIVRPSEDEVARYRLEITRRSTRLAELAAMRDLSSQTLDGTPVQLLANIEFPHELAACLERRAAGVGLYRTEFLYFELRYRADGRRAFPGLLPGHRGHAPAAGRDPHPGPGGRQTLECPDDRRA